MSRKLDLTYLCEHVPLSIVEDAMSSCLIQEKKEDKALSEIIIFIDELCAKNGLNKENNILIGYREKIEARIKDLDVEAKSFSDKEEIEALFLSDAKERDIPLTENGARLLFENLYALIATDHGYECIYPKFLIEFHIAMLWDEGMMRECVPQAVMDVYHYYY